MLKLLNQHPYKCGARRGAKKFRQNINRLQSLQKRHYKFANVRLNPKVRSKSLLQRRRTLDSEHRRHSGIRYRRVL